MKTIKGKPPKTPSGGVDWAETNRVLDFMTQNGLEEFEFSKGDLRIRLKKPGQSPLVQPNMAVPVAGHAPAAAPVGAPPAGAGAAASEAATENLHLVKSPIVGTFYSSANPQSPPYVKAGDRVTSGQVLCIIEAMKLMNEIESDVSGEVVKILIPNAQPVEYGEALFAIRVDGT